VAEKEGALSEAEERLAGEQQQRYLFEKGMKLEPFWQ